MGSGANASIMMQQVRMRTEDASMLSVRWSRRDQPLRFLHVQTTVRSIVSIQVQMDKTAYTNVF